jgi:hypothetical protein
MLLGLARGQMKLPGLRAGMKLSAGLDRAR